MDEEFAALVRRDNNRRAHFKKCLQEALTDSDNKFDSDLHPFPWRMDMVIWDGPGVQFFDANSKPVFSDLIRDVDMAAMMLDICNRVGVVTTALNGGER